MTSGRDEYLERTKKHIDYDKESERREWWLNNTGGAAADNMTVRDVFASEAMAGLIRHFDFDQFKQDPMRVAAWSYDMADEMMKERAK